MSNGEGSSKKKKKKDECRLLWMAWLDLGPLKGSVKTQSLAQLMIGLSMDLGLARSYYSLKIEDCGLSKRPDPEPNSESKSLIELDLGLELQKIDSSYTKEFEWEVSTHKNRAVYLPQPLTSHIPLPQISTSPIKQSFRSLSSVPFFFALQAVVIGTTPIIVKFGPKNQQIRAVYSVQFESL